MPLIAPGFRRYLPVSPLHHEPLGYGLPRKRPHGNRIRAWGLSASSSAPILHRVSSLDGVRATGETLRSASSQRTTGEPDGGAFLLLLLLLLHGLRKVRTRSASTGPTPSISTPEEKRRNAAVMDIMTAVQDACVSGQWLTAVLLSLCCFLPSCLPGQTVPDYSSVESVVSRQGDTALLRCYLLDGISKGAWLNRSSIIFAGKDKWSVDPRVSIVSSVGDKHEYSLQIQKVDVSDDGQYTCSIQSERNPRPKLLNLIVKVPPKIYDISSNITVNEGSNVSLICTASGKPEPSISWRHITPLARKYDSGEYLNITGITRDQAGDYECSALNDIASPDTKTVKVTVNFAPSIHETKSHGVGLGRTALLRCEAAAVPWPTFEWYKGEKRIIKGQGIEIKNLNTRSILTMTNMTEDRYGNYTCVASNKLGTANASVPLNPPNTAPYGSTGSADAPLACRYLVLALSSFISVY